MLDIFVTILWHQDHEKIAGMRFSSHISQQSAAVLSHGKYSMNLYSFNRYFSEIPSISLHSFNVIYVMLRHLLAQFPGESIGWSTGQSGRHEQCQHRICWDVLTWSFWNSKKCWIKDLLKSEKTFASRKVRVILIFHPIPLQFEPYESVRWRPWISKRSSVELQPHYGFLVRRVECYSAEMTEMWLWHSMVFRVAPFSLGCCLTRYELGSSLLQICCTCDCRDSNMNKWKMLLLLHFWQS